MNAEGPVITGLGHVVLGPGDPPCDPLPYLRARKSRKFMGVQDDLAVVAAGLALRSAGDGVRLGERAGLYMAVGYIPFDASDIEAILAASLEDGRFSMSRFSTEGYAAVNPLLTFRCLSNMPAYHVSVNFDLRGPYLVTYPGPAQTYLALEEALGALEAGVIDAALVGGVAHQRNWLVESHGLRLRPPADVASLRDAAGFLVIERSADALARGATVRRRLRHYRIAYRRHDPFDEPTLHADDPMGSASLPVALSLHRAPCDLDHTVRGRDGIEAQSSWEVA